MGEQLNIKLHVLSLESGPQQLQCLCEKELISWFTATEVSWAGFYCFECWLLEFCYLSLSLFNFVTCLVHFMDFFVETVNRWPKCLLHNILWWKFVAHCSRFLSRLYLILTSCQQLYLVIYYSLFLLLFCFVKAFYHKENWFNLISPCIEYIQFIYSAVLFRKDI